MSMVGAQIFNELQAAGRDGLTNFWEKNKQRVEILSPPDRKIIEELSDGMETEAGFPQE